MPQNSIVISFTFAFLGDVRLTSAYGNLLRIPQIGHCPPHSSLGTLVICGHLCVLICEASRNTLNTGMNLFIETRFLGAAFATETERRNWLGCRFKQASR